MTTAARPDDDRAAQVWRQLTAAAAQAESFVPGAAPAGFADRVLAAVAARPMPADRQPQQRILAIAAGLSLAASVLVCAWGWSDIKSVWSAPSIFEQLVQVEPWP